MKTSSISAATPDPTPLLFLVAAMATWVWLTGDAGSGTPWITAAVLLPLVGIAAYAFYTRPLAALALLLGASVMSRFYVEIGGLKARPEHLAAGLLSIVALLIWKRRSEPVRWITADLLLLAYIALNLISSLTRSIAPGETLKWAIQQVLVILCYFLLRILVSGPGAFRRAVRMLSLVGALEGAYAVICFSSNLLFNTTFGVAIEQYGSFPGPYGTLLEANILGAFCGASLVIALLLYVKERRGYYLLEAALAYSGLVIALSRAAIIASAISVIVLVIAGTKIGVGDRRALRKAGVALLGTTLVLAPAIIPLYTERFSTVQVSDVSADADTAVRLVSIGLAIDDILQQPVLGNGTASFQLLVSNRELGFGDLDTAAWIGNLEIRVLHDTGIVGLITLIVFLIYLIRPAWRIVRTQQNVELLALLVAGLIYCVTFQATEGTLLAFSWVHLGLIACAVSIYGPFRKPSGTSLRM